MVSINFTYDSLGLSKSLTVSQEISLNQSLNVTSEISLIIRLYKYIYFLMIF